MQSEQILVVASSNQHKVKEITTMVSDLNFKVIGLDELGDLADVVEDGETFQDNAAKKAREIQEQVKYLTLADDSGLEVDALRGAPGVYSARFAASGDENADDAKNNRKLLHMLEGLPPEKRGAQFRCVMALALPNGDMEFTEGICRGQIGFSPRGSNGFGYDPLFIIPQYRQTFAQISPEIKNEISHRGRAMRQMREILRQYEINFKTKHV